MAGRLRASVVCAMQFTIRPQSTRTACPQISSVAELCNHILELTNGEQTPQGQLDRLTAQWPYWTCISADFAAVHSDSLSPDQLSGRVV